MSKLLGIFLLLVALVVVTSVLNPNFLDAYNLRNTASWTALFGIIAIGVALVIVTGGIDLSIGSVVGLVGTTLAVLVTGYGVWPPLAIAIALALSMGIGLFHGLLITRLRLQPFIVTLCGLLLYRGIARYVGSDQSQGFGTAHETLRYLSVGQPLGIPMAVVFLVAIAVVAHVFLHVSVYGRYLFALGRNEGAARFSGINTRSMTILAYVICSTLAGFAGVLFAVDLNSISPSNHGNFYELYAIAAAVLGGCSLRGGEGSIIGAIIGTAVLQVLRNAINLLAISSQVELAVIGLVLLLGVSADEVARLIASYRRRKLDAAAASVQSQPSGDPNE